MLFGNVADLSCTFYLAVSGLLAGAAFVLLLLSSALEQVGSCSGGGMARKTYCLQNGNVFEPLEGIKLQSLVTLRLPHQDTDLKCM